VSNVLLSELLIDFVQSVEQRDGDVTKSIAGAVEATRLLGYIHSMIVTVEEGPRLVPVDVTKRAAHTPWHRTIVFTTVRRREVVEQHT